MEHLFVISQASYFSPAAMSSQVYHSTENNFKTKHPRAFGLAAAAPPVVKKEAFTQPLTKATSPIVVCNKKKETAKDGDDHHTHENTSSGGSDLPHNKLRASTTSSSTSPPLSPSSEFLVAERGCIVAKPDNAILPEGVAEDLVSKTEKRVQHALQKSHFLTHHGAKILSAVPTFTMATGDEQDDDEQGEVVRRELLGQGGFAAIYAVDIRTPQRLRHHHVQEQQQYVVKHLNSKLYDGNFVDSANRKLQLGAKDIVIESQMLAALNHRHIISLEGISKGGVRCFEMQPRTDAYFMILPRLECTLAEKLSAWKHERLAASIHHHHHSSSSTPRSWWRRYGRRSVTTTTTLTQQEQHEAEFLCERLQIVIDLCKALEYLHDKSIMHRDIKPPNIGFDKDGTLKLFDFGLAKEVPHLDPSGIAFALGTNGSNHSATGFFGLGSSKPMMNAGGCMGNTGTTRYMAPEIIRREPYTTKVDVYATSIVCWEVMTLLKPYGNDTNGQFVKECVALYDDRPTIPGNRSNSKLTVWPKSLKKLVQQAWQRDQVARLTANELRKGLEQIVDKKKRLLSVMTASATEQQQPSLDVSVSSAKSSMTTSQPPKQQQQPLQRQSSGFQGVVTEIML